MCSNGDTQRFHQEAITKHQAEYQKLESRIQSMHVDKLDDKILGDFFDSMSAKWRTEQSEILQAIQTHQNANQNYIVEGVKLFELAQSAYKLFVQQDPMEKRRLLNFLVSNSYWAGKTLRVELKKPFDLLMKLSELTDQEMELGVLKKQHFENWLPEWDDFRTFRVEIADTLNIGNKLFSMNSNEVLLSAHT